MAAFSLVATSADRFVFALPAIPDKLVSAMTSTDPPDDRPADTASLQDVTREQLYRLARELEIDGRSSMSKSELVAAVRSAISGENRSPQADQGAGQEKPPAHIGDPSAASRTDAFELLAQAAGRRELVMLPRLLQGNDRRLHVRQTIREDHQTRIAHRSEDAARKFDKLADCVFDFFRGTALLFYRDMVGEDAWMPTALVLGDVHPGNFGVMPNADNVPIFAVNDFDEAYYAPFTWDLKRGAVGFMLAAEAAGGYKGKKQRKIAARFLRGYVAGINGFAKNATEKSHEVRADNAPPLIRDLIEDAMTDRSDWLADDYLDESLRGFRSDEELVPISSRREEFQKLVNDLVRDNEIRPPTRAGKMRVKDVAIRKGQGTASLGLPRYYVLLEGPRGDGTDDLIIELKQARKSALAGLVPPTGNDFVAPGRRIVHAQAVQVARGDRFYGSATFEGMSFMSRERAPFRDDIDLDDLSKSEWKSYAEICGHALAHAHALSDEIGYLEHDVEPQIVQAIGPPELFTDDILRFAEEASERVRRDHQMFREDHAQQAFQTVDHVYA